MKVAAVVLWVLAMAPGLILAWDAWAWLIGFPQWHDWASMTGGDQLDLAGLSVIWCFVFFMPATLAAGSLLDD